MGELVTYKQFRRKQREKKYGTDASRLRRLKAMGWPESGMLEDLVEEMELLYGESEEDEEDFWLGVKPIDEVIK